MNHRNQRTIRRLLAIKAATLHKSLSALELAEAVHVCHPSALDYIRDLHANGQMHITGWRDTAPGKRAALYRWGPGTDAPKPVPRTKAELQRAYIARLRKDGMAYDRLRAADRVRSVVAKAKSTKNTWLGALTC